MLFDINAYTGHWPFKQLQYNTCEKLLERMNRFGVQQSVISNLNGIFYKNTQPANEELFNEINSDKRFIERFIPFAVINPIYAGWKADFETCCSKLGMKGIRLYPLYHDYEMTEPSLIELVKMAAGKGLPVAFTLRMVDSRQRSWMDIDKEWAMKDIIPIIKAVPDAKYMVLNVANDINLDDETAVLIKNTDILIDTSGREITDLGHLIKKYGRDKFALGTHAPILDYLTGIMRIESLRESEADEETKEMIRSGNAIRFLGF
jgi:uncharacterized protein